MSPAGSNDAPQVSSTALKKGKNKKKKNGTKPTTNGDSVKVQKSENDEEVDVDEGEAEGVEVDSPTVAHAKELQSPAQDLGTQTNGHQDLPLNGSVPPKIHLPTHHQAQPQSLTEDSTDASEEQIPRNASDTTDASNRLEVMSQDREALRAEVGQLRKSLEDLQTKHDEEISSIRAELEESESAREHAQTQYQTLLGKINTIKSTLGERMAADRRELAEAKDQIEELEAQNESLKASTKTLEVEVSKLRDESEETSRELSSLRNRHNLSQQNWLGERQDLTQQNKHFKEEAEAAKEAMGDWEVLAMEERSIREGLADRVSELEEQLSTQKEAYERAASERDGQSQAVDGLQRALREIQEARKAELREMVESSQAQLDVLNKLLQQAEARALEAEAAREALTKEVDRLAPFEGQVKEKNLLIGKLRHEAIILNDHLTKALRFLKKAKPEDNIDRQIVTNHLLQFLALDRTDPKKFQILQIIAALLNWTDEQKEQAGLARPGASNSSLRLPISPFHRTPSTPSLSSEFFPETSSSRENKESLAELWAGFLEQQAEEGSKPGSRSGSMSSNATPTTSRPDIQG